MIDLSKFPRAKEEFEKWHWDNIYDTQIRWDALLPCMKVGVFVDYLDSVGIILYASPNFARKGDWGFTLISKDVFRSKAHNERNKAQKAGITKAFEIREEQLNK